MARAETPFEKVACKHILECQFGEIEYGNDDIISFPEGLFGFEKYTQYLVWQDEEYFPFRWLICVENPQLLFPVIDPRVVYPDYDPRVNGGGVWDSILSIVVIGDSMESVTLNLRAPVLIDRERQRGKQIILTDSHYPLRYRVVH